MKARQVAVWFFGVLLLAATCMATLVFAGYDARSLLSWLRSGAPEKTAVAAGPIKVGMAVGLTGANGVIAPTVVQAAQLAVDEINENGGILGRKVVLEVLDDGSGAEGSVKAFNTLIERKVDAIIAMQTSGARNAALPVLSRGKVPYIYTSFYEGRSCNPWMHVNGWVPEQQVAPIVNYLAKEKGATNFFLIGSDYSFGRGMLEFARKSIRDAGGQVAGEEYLPIEAADWSSVIAKIRAAKPDALISATAGGAPNVSLAKQLRAAGINLPYGNLAIDENTAKSMGDLATNVLVAGSYFISIDSSENRSFLMRMIARYGMDIKPPNELSVPQYEAFYLYKAAVERAKSTDPEKVTQALSEVSYEGPRGVVKMSQGRHAALSMRLGRVRSDGSIAILKTFLDVDPGTQCPDAAVALAK